MSIKSELNGIINAYINEVLPMFDRIRAISGSEAGQREIPGIDAKISAAQQNALNRGERAINAYIDRLNAAFAISGAKINEKDLQLLNDSFEWTQEQLDGIIERSKNNPVMMNACNAYAKRHGLICPDTDERSRRESVVLGAWRTFESYVKNGGQYSVHEYAAALAQDGGLFNELTLLTE